MSRMRVRGSSSDVPPARFRLLSDGRRLHALLLGVHRLLGRRAAFLRLARRRSERTRALFGK